jgi:RimJ/RimL family protein N-acetyltransferase
MGHVRERHLLMEKMPFQPGRGTGAVVTTGAVAAAARGDWRTGLPTLSGSIITLRELRPSDAPALFESMANDEVARFISPPPSTAEGFERFIEWTLRQRAAGQYVCFAVVPRGSDVAIGLFQIRSLEPAFGNAEWGFAIDCKFWGTGVFVDGAKLAIDFAFQALGTHRLEARASTENARGNGALRKIGATEEAVLRRSFLRGGEYHDQTLWTILREDWTNATVLSGPSVVH